MNPKNPIAWRRIVLGCVTGVLPIVVLAAAPDAGQILREQELTLPRSIERPVAPAPETVRPALPDNGVKVRVRSIRFTGAQGLATEEQLQAQVKDALDRELGFGELQQLAERVTRYLKDRGWFLARAYLPQQDITDGDIEIAILRGRLDGGAGGHGIGIQADGVRLDQAHIRAILDRALAAGGDSLRGTDLERGLLLLNDLPGITARSSLERGSAPGTTQVNVQVSEGPWITGSAWADNYGNRYTGAARANAQVNVNDPFRYGDQIVLGATAAEGLTLGRIAYSAPIGYSGLRASAGYTALTYEIGKELAAVGSEGSANTVNAQLAYAFVRSRPFNLSGSVGYEGKALQDETLGVVTRDKRVEDWSVLLSGDAFDSLAGGGLSNFSLTLTHGDLDLSRVPADLSADQSTARTQGNFSKVNYNVARLQKLSDRFTLFGALSGQTAGKNLDSSEKFMLGGPGGVRAYPVGEASGDEGWVGTAELRYDMPGKYAGGALQVLGFFDAGSVTLSKNPFGPAPNATNENRYALRGAGVGANLTSSGRFVLRGAWAAKIGDNPGRSAQGNDSDGKNADSRFWLQALMWF